MANAADFYSNLNSLIQKWTIEGKGVAGIEKLINQRIGQWNFVYKSTPVDYDTAISTYQDYAVNGPKDSYQPITNSPGGGVPDRVAGEVPWEPITPTEPQAPYIPPVTTPPQETNNGDFNYDTSTTQGEKPTDHAYGLDLTEEQYTQNVMKWLGDQVAAGKDIDSLMPSVEQSVTSWNNQNTDNPLSVDNLLSQFNSRKGDSSGELPVGAIAAGVSSIQKDLETILPKAVSDGVITQQEADRLTAQLKGNPIEDPDLSSAQWGEGVTNGNIEKYAAANNIWDYEEFKKLHESTNLTPISKDKFDDWKVKRDRDAKGQLHFWYPSSNMSYHEAEQKKNQVARAAEANGISRQEVFDRNQYDTLTDKDSFIRLRDYASDGDNPLDDIGDLGQEVGYALDKNFNIIVDPFDAFSFHTNARDVVHDPSSIDPDVDTQRLLGTIATYVTVGALGGGDWSNVWDYIAGNDPQPDTPNEGGGNTSPPADPDPGFGDGSDSLWTDNQGRTRNQLGDVVDATGKVLITADAVDNLTEEPVTDLFKDSTGDTTTDDTNPPPGDVDLSLLDQLKDMSAQELMELGLTGAQIAAIFGAATSDPSELGGELNLHPKVEGELYGQGGILDQAKGLHDNGLLSDTDLSEHYTDYLGGLQDKTTYTNPNLSRYGNALDSRLGDTLDQSASEPWKNALTLQADKNLDTTNPYTNQLNGMLGETFDSSNPLTAQLESRMGRDFDPANPYAQELAGMAGETYNPDNPYSNQAQGLLNESFDGTAPFIDRVNGFLDTSYDPQNPYMAKTLANAQEDAMMNARSNAATEFAAAGRSGSDAESGVFAREFARQFGKESDRILSDQYNRDEANKINYRGLQNDVLGMGIDATLRNQDQDLSFRDQNVGLLNNVMSDYRQGEIADITHRGQNIDALGRAVQDTRTGMGQQLTHEGQLDNLLGYGIQDARAGMGQDLDFRNQNVNLINTGISENANARRDNIAWENNRNDAIKAGLNQFNNEQTQQQNFRNSQNDVLGMYPGLIQAQNDQYNQQLQAQGSIADINSQLASNQNLSDYNALTRYNGLVTGAPYPVNPTYYGPSTAQQWAGALGAIGGIYGQYKDSQTPQAQQTPFASAPFNYGQSSSSIQEPYFTKWDDSYYHTESF